MPSSNQRLIFRGQRLNDEKFIAQYCIPEASTIHLIEALKGGKPVVYLLSPTPMDVRVKLSLVPSWSFSAIYPPVPTSGSKYHSITWNVHVRPDKTLRCHDTGLDVAYLYWEALYVYVSI